jgi:hypothetical protein
MRNGLAVLALGAGACAPGPVVLRTAGQENKQVHVGTFSVTNTAYPAKPAWLSTPSAALERWALPAAQAWMWTEPGSSGNDPATLEYDRITTASSDVFDFLAWVREQVRFAEQDRAAVSMHTHVITVATPVAITTQPANRNGAVDGTVTFTVVPATTTGVTYRWQFKPFGGSRYDDLSLADVHYTGVATDTLHVNGLQPSDHGRFRCVLMRQAAVGVVSMACSDGALLTVEP